MATPNNCTPVACGELIHPDSIPADRLEYESFYTFLKEIVTNFFKESWFKELLREYITESFKEEWFKEILKEYIIESSKEEWFHELVQTIIVEAVDEDWLRDLIEQILKSYINEQWFYDLICGLGCGGTSPIFEVSPQEIVFDAAGGLKYVTVTTTSGTTWNVTC